jgi:ubiquinone/menaquinone biosynthesis C-methylase UbiE
MISVRGTAGEAIDAVAAPATSAFWHEVGRQLRNPTGPGGRLVGLLMALVNRKPNRIAIDALHLARGDRILELGFGPGRAISRVAMLAPNSEICGIDQSAEMLALASRHNRASIRRGQVTLAQGRLAALPFSSASFDKILAVNVAYFFGHDGTELREARRVLRRGGRMVLYVSDRESMARWAFAKCATHRTFSVDEFVTMARYGGFAANEISFVPVSLPFGIGAFVATLHKGN